MRLKSPQNLHLFLSSSAPNRPTGIFFLSPQRNASRRILFNNRIQLSYGDADTPSAPVIQ